MVYPYSLHVISKSRLSVILTRKPQNYLQLLFYILTVSSQSCTTDTLDPRNVNNYDPSRLVPLFRQYPETSSISGEQWIFPNLRFTCYGTLTQWIFAGVPGQAATPCRVELGTWRPADTSSTIYGQRSTTERGFVTITQDGQIFTYDLASPVLVEPGDIVGIELRRFCAPLEDLDNVLSHNISGTDSSYLSYRKDGSGPTFFLQSSSIIPEQDFVPLIEAVVGELRINVLYLYNGYGWIQQKASMVSPLYPSPPVYERMQIHVYSQQSGINTSLAMAYLLIK